MNFSGEKLFQPHRDTGLAEPHSSSFENKNIQKFEIEFQGKNYQLEFSKSHVEYPEKYAQETGILGYEKKTISWDSLKEILKNILSKEIDTFDQLKKEIALLGMNFDQKEFKEQNYGAKNQQFQFLLNKILESATDSNFPSKTFNHTMYTYMMGVKPQTFSDHDLEDKVFSPEFVAEKATVRRGVGLTDDLMPGVDGSWVILKSDSGKSTKNPSSRGSSGFHLSDVREGVFGKLADDQKQRIFSIMNGENKNEYLTSVAGGFIAEQYSLWDSGSGSKMFSTLNVGFQNDTFMQKYADACIEDMRSANRNNPDKQVFPMSSIIRAYYLKEMPKEGVRFGKFLARNSTKKLDGNGRPIEDVSSHIKEYMKEHGGPFSMKDDDRTLFAGYDDLNHQGRKYGGSTESDYYIPVFINHPTIPQLRLGHAKYASFPSEEGFNVITMEHADELPSKEK